MIVAASAGNAVAMGIGGVVCVLAVCAVFYVIGRGEDRDRARVARTVVPPEVPDADTAPHGSEPPPRSRSRPLRSSQRRRRP